MHIKCALGNVQLFRPQAFPSPVHVSVNGEHQHNDLPIHGGLSPLTTKHTQITRGGNVCLSNVPTTLRLPH